LNREVVQFWLSSLNNSAGLFSNTLMQVSYDSAVKSLRNKIPRPHTERFSSLSLHKLHCCLRQVQKLTFLPIFERDILVRSENTERKKHSYSAFHSEPA